MRERCHYYQDKPGETFFRCKNTKRSRGQYGVFIPKAVGCDNCSKYISESQFMKDVKEMMQ